MFQCAMYTFQHTMQVQQHQGPNVFTLEDHDDLTAAPTSAAAAATSSSAAAASATAMTTRSKTILQRQLGTVNSPLAFCSDERYKDMKKIGSGAQSVVYTAFDIKHKRRVAVKCISLITKHRSSSDENSIDPWTECNALRVLRHENILRLYCVLIESTQQSQMFLVTEYCERGALLEHINEVYRQKKLFSADTIRNWLIQLASALDYAHRNGVAHRDVKLENIFIRRDYSLVLGDWGFSCHVSQANDDTRTDYVGSLAYCAPELLVHRPYRAQQVDVWSLGVVLFTLFHGRLPFPVLDKQTMTERLDTLHMGPSFSSHMDTSAIELILAMLTVLPTYRITMRNVLLHRWTLNQPVPTSSESTGTSPDASMRHANRETVSLSPDVLSKIAAV